MINNTSEKKRFYGWTIVVSLWIIYFLMSASRCTEVRR